ncbi:hypothetical protein O6H91_06G026000 [Diphasiastrum complanatum]|uniref:Uncharacterized protein n=1 Tax=Diphasiastrum complanatum TaxID=34168 RepID=A0ACC2DBT8_DIPCM|nr:hypothetical protein O6H91_06G026000 [Diphasiastrum complanatum]
MSLLSSLPPSYDNLVLLLANTPDLSLQKVTTSLLHKEVRRKSLSTSNTKIVALYSNKQQLLKKKSSNDKKTKAEQTDSNQQSQKHNRQHQQLKTRLFCKYCKRTNHDIKDCRFLKHNEAKKKMQQDGGSDFAKTSQEEPTLLMIQDLPIRDDWYLDSGASQHMTACKFLCEDLTQANSKYVYFGDSNALEIGGKGSIRLYLRKLTLLENVLYYVPRLTNNLLSVSKFTDQGCKALFDSKQCTILDKHNKEIFSANREGNLYVLRHEYALSTNLSTSNAQLASKTKTSKHKVNLLYAS